MVLRMKAAGLINSAFVTLEIGSKSDDILFGDRDEDKIPTEDLIHRSDTTKEDYWDAPIARFGYDSLQELDSMTIVFINGYSVIYLPQTIF